MKNIYFALICLICLNSVNGIDYYVSVTGDDNNLGTDTNSPFRTIQKAASTLGVNSGSIILKSGVHKISPIEIQSGFVVIAAETPLGATITLDETTTVDNTNPVDFLKFIGLTAEIKDIIFTHPEETTYTQSQDINSFINFGDTVGTLTNVRFENIQWKGILIIGSSSVVSAVDSKFENIKGDNFENIIWTTSDLYFTRSYATDISYCEYSVFEGDNSATVTDSKIEGIVPNSDNGIFWAFSGGVHIIRSQFIDNSPNVLVKADGSVLEVIGSNFTRSSGTLVTAMSSVFTDSNFIGDDTPTQINLITVFSGSTVITGCHFEGIQNPILYKGFTDNSIEIKDSSFVKITGTIDLESAAATVDNVSYYNNTGAGFWLKSSTVLQISNSRFKYNTPESTYGSVFSCSNSQFTVDSSVAIGNINEYVNLGGCVVHNNGYTTGQITTGVTTGVTTGLTTGITTGVTTGDTTGFTTGITTGVTTGITTGVTTELSTGITTGITTGVTTGLTTGEPVTTSVPISTGAITTGSVTTGSITTKSITTKLITTKAKPITTKKITTKPVTTKSMTTQSVSTGIKPVTTRFSKIRP